MLPDELPTSSIATGTFPYHELGPISFATQNFVETCQTDNYYDPSGRLESVVRECYSATGALWTVIGFVSIFIAALMTVVYLISRRYRG